MSSKGCYRFKKPDVAVNTLSSLSVPVNFGVGGHAAKFPLDDVDAVSGIFYHNTYIVDGYESLDMSFPDMFTIAFWAKFEQGQIEDTIYGNRFVVILEDGTTIEANIPSSVVLTSWNYYTVVRDDSNDIKMAINGNVIYTANSSANFNLKSGCYIYLGNLNKHSTGYVVAADDILICDTALYDGSFTPPTEYIDLSSFRQFLYIVVSTGEVWGYALIGAYILIASALTSLGLLAENTASSVPVAVDVPMSATSSFEGGYISQSDEINSNLRDIRVYSMYVIQPMVLSSWGLQDKNFVDSKTRSVDSVAMTMPVAFEGGYYTESSVIDARNSIGVDIL